MRHILVLLVMLLVSFILQAQSLLFEITGNGLHKPSYLLGTIHLTQKKDKALYTLAFKRLKTCQSYVMEITPSDFNQAEIIKKILIPEGKTIKDFVTKDIYDSLATKFYSLTGLNLETVKIIQPIFLLPLLQTNPNAQQKGQTKNFMMDLSLAERAKKMHKEVKGIETLDEQLSALLEISIQEQVEQLLGNNTEAEQIYQSKDINQIYEASIETMTPEEVKHLLLDRNARMVERATDLLTSQQTFIAVGAAHLGGEKGLVNLLRQQGYVLREINK